MKLELFDELVEISPSRTVVLHDATDVQIVCVDGRIWLTEDRLQNDVVLESGESHRVRSDGKTFVTAFRPSSVRLLEPLRRDPRERGRLSSLWPSALRQARVY